MQVTDAEGMREQGISPSEVAQIVSKTFNDMIFIHGHVHCDPHSANLLVRKDKHGKVIWTAPGPVLEHSSGQALARGWAACRCAIMRAGCLGAQWTMSSLEGMCGGSI